MERSKIRGRTLPLAMSSPHFAPLNAGYEMLWGGGEEIVSIVADVNRWSPLNAKAE